jgi:hypothetical protein
MHSAIATLWNLCTCRIMQEYTAGRSCRNLYISRSDLITSSPPHWPYVIPGYMGAQFDPKRSRNTCVPSLTPSDPGIHVYPVWTQFSCLLHTLAVNPAWQWVYPNGKAVWFFADDTTISWLVKSFIRRLIGEPHASSWVKTVNCQLKRIVNSSVTCSCNFCTS